MEQNIEIEELFGKSDIIENKNTEIVSVEEELDIPKVHLDIELKYDKAEHKGDMEDYSDDILYVRNVLLKNIGSADRILESLLKKIVANDEIGEIEEAGASKNSARYYEVSSLLIKSICEAGKELLNLHATNLKIKGNDIDKKENENGNNLNVVDLIREIKATNK